MKKSFKILYIDSEVHPKATAPILEHVFYCHDIIASITVSDDILKAMSFMEDTLYDLIFVAVNNDHTSSFRPLFSLFRSSAGEIPIILMGKVDIIFTPETLLEFKITGVLRKPYTETSICEIVSQYYSRNTHY